MAGFVLPDSAKSMANAGSFQFPNMPSLPTMSGAMGGNVSEATHKTQINVSPSLCRPTLFSLALIGNAIEGLDVEANHAR